MLDTHQYIENLNDIQNKIYNSYYLKEVDRKNLSPKEQAEFDLKLFEISNQTALSLIQIMQKEKELEFSLYKARAELEINIINAKAQATDNQAKALLSVIQAYVTKTSITDNANIQRANIYTQLIQVIANASNLNAISQKDANGNSHVSNAISIINKIKDTEAPDLDTALNDCITDLIRRSGEVMLLGVGSQDVFIFAVKKELQVNENLEIYGMHIFGNNESEFIIDNKETIKGRTLLFKSDTQGKFNIEFRVRNIDNKWISTNAVVVVKENIIDSNIPPKKAIALF